MLTLREIGERTAAARAMKGFWSQVIKGLEYNSMTPSTEFVSTWATIDAYFSVSLIWTVATMSFPSRHL
jgi:hypothetical protein